MTEIKAANGRVLVTIAADCLAHANLRGVNLGGAYLRGANLWGADLHGANLRGADLREAYLQGAILAGANLAEANLTRTYLTGVDLRGAVMPDGGTWEEYLRVTVPALLTAGGRPLAAVATPEHWGCHSWDNCPLAVAFGGRCLEDVPLLLRPRAAEFVHFFDAGLIPLPGAAPE